MNSIYNYTNQMSDIVDLERKERDRRRRELNSSMMVDFATNLMSMISKGKGLRYSVATNNATMANKRYAEAQERLVRAQHDYKALRAMQRLGGLLPGRRKSVTAEHDVKGGNGSYEPIFMKPILLKPGLVKPEKPQLLNLSGYGKINH